MFLVTGCNSLLGRTLVKRLLKDGAAVKGLDFWRESDYPENLEFIEGSVLDHDLLLNISQGVEVVYHLMDIRNSSHFGRRLMKRINVSGIENVIAAAKENSIKKVIHLSTADVYGKPRAMPIRQDDPKKPVTRYGKDKLRAEKVCWRYNETDSVDITIFRPTLIAGPGVEDPLILIILYMALGMGDSNRLYVAGDGDSMFQLVHPDDVVEALISAYSIPNTRGKIYNLGSDNVPTQMEQVVKVKELAKLDCHTKRLSPLAAKMLSFVLRPLNVSYLTREHVIFILSNFVLDCDMAKRDLNWYPKKNNIDIFVETIEWYEKERL
jgi:nucleoside-diphosphate-sugar epimerase